MVGFFEEEGSIEMGGWIEKRRTQRLGGQGKIMRGYRHLFSFYFVLFSLVLGTAGWLVWGQALEWRFCFWFHYEYLLKFIAWFISRTSDDDYILPWFLIRDSGLGSKLMTFVRLLVCLYSVLVCYASFQTCRCCFMP